jgi:BMFP domain-containing protein YqiC
MTQWFWNSLVYSPILLAFVAVPAAIANDRPTHPLSPTVITQAADREVEVGGLEQVTSVSQLTDVRPTDWAFQALQSLVERYGCIVGYPDRSFRGNQALTRYEFAAGVNACMDRINELIAASTADLVRKEDLLVLQRLQEEFAAELATLRGRVDALEARATTLEKQQFSTTTKLSAEVVFARVSIMAGDNALGDRIDRSTIVGDRVRLNFDTSFTGEDLLRTRLQAFNLDAYSGSATFTPEGDLRFAGGAFETGNANAVEIDALLYQFPLGDKLTVTLEANAGASDDFIPTINPFFDGDGGAGALSQFASRNAIYYLLNGAGIGLQYRFSDALELGVGYLANDPANPAAGAGLFNGPYGAIAQLTFTPSERLAIGLTYVHAYNNDFTANGSTGSNRANLRAALANNANLPAPLSSFAGLDLPTSSNAFGAAVSFQISPKIVLNGSAGYTKTRTLSSLGGILPRGDLDIWNWSAGLAFPDFLKKGSVLGVMVGMEPKVTEVSSQLRSEIGEDPDTSLHIEGFYQFQLNDNIAITPGIIWLTAPDHNNDNNDVLIGVVRTTFTF